MCNGFSHNVCSLKHLSEGDKFIIPGNSAVMAVKKHITLPGETQFSVVVVDQNDQRELIPTFQIPLPGSLLILINQNVKPLES
jgi:hypothetical protein